MTYWETESPVLGVRPQQDWAGHGAPTPDSRSSQGAGGRLAQSCTVVERQVLWRV